MCCVVWLLLCAAVLQGINTEHILKTRGLTKHFTISGLLVRLQGFGGQAQHSSSAAAAWDKCAGGVRAVLSLCRQHLCLHTYSKEVWCCAGTCRSRFLMRGG